MEDLKPPQVTISLLGLAAIAALGAIRLVSHEKVCAERWRDVRGDLQRGEMRMARIERLMWAVAASFVMLLLSVLAYLLTHGSPWRNA